MAIDLTAIEDVMASHAQGLGGVERVLRHEPVDAPGSGVTVVMSVSRVDPVAARSGLDATSVRVVVTARVMANLSDPADDIDTGVLAVADALMAAYSGDFGLGGQVANIDLLGHHGIPMAAMFGYTTLSSVVYRVATVTVPLVINDAWAQTP